MWNVLTQKKRFGGSITHLFTGLILCALHLHVIFEGEAEISPGNYPANTLTTPRATHPSTCGRSCHGGQRSECHDLFDVVVFFFFFWNCCNQSKDLRYVKKTRDSFSVYLLGSAISNASLQDLTHRLLYGLHLWRPVKCDLSDLDQVQDCHVSALTFQTVSCANVCLHSFNYFISVQTAIWREAAYRLWKKAGWLKQPNWCVKMKKINK